MIGYLALARDTFDINYALDNKKLFENLRTPEKTHTYYFEALLFHLVCYLFFGVVFQRYFHLTMIASVTITCY